MNENDNILMANLKNGKVKALAILVERYKKQAYFLALGMVGNSDDAYDISQEAFLRVYNSAATFDETRKFFPWFYSIVINLCRNVQRKRQLDAARTVDMDEVDYLLVDRATPESSLVEKDEKRRLLLAMKKLNFKDREIINLNHFRMMSYDEIAEVLNVPKGTVMSRLFYARKKLAELMEEV